MLAQWLRIASRAPLLLPTFSLNLDISGPFPMLVFAVRSRAVSMCKLSGRRVMQGMTLPPSQCISHLFFSLSRLLRRILVGRGVVACCRPFPRCPEAVVGLLLPSAAVWAAFFPRDSSSAALGLLCGTVGQFFCYSRAVCHPLWGTLHSGVFCSASLCFSAPPLPLGCIGAY